ncbi:MAG: hypothetical protein SGJ18_15140 [Pseudomonadota bacterium]|nr:hypothetical protein [Pseudomonadota bacterium]
MLRLCKEIKTGKLVNIEILESEIHKFNDWLIYGPAFRDEAGKVIQAEFIDLNVKGRPFVNIEKIALKTKHKDAGLSFSNANKRPKPSDRNNHR